MEANEETRDWAELPRDLLLAVLHRLHHADVLTGAGQVCRPWRGAAREEPELWRRIDLRRRAGAALSAPSVHLDALAHAAVRRSAGQCEAFWAEPDVVDHNFIVFLSLRAPRLKSLRLIPCKISTQVLSGAITRFPMLEELELSLWAGATTASGHYINNLAETCAAAAKACPLLKRLRLRKYLFHRLSAVGDSEAMEIAKMRGLRCLQLFGNSLSNVGLAAILGGCVRLESLDIRHCFNVEVNDETRVMCARLQTLRLPDDSMDGNDLSFGSPETEMNPGITGLRFPDNPVMDFGFRGDILWDSW